MHTVTKLLIVLAMVVLLMPTVAATNYNGGSAIIDFHGVAGGAGGSYWIQWYATATTATTNDPGFNATPNNGWSNSIVNTKPGIVIWATNSAGVETSFGSFRMVSGAGLADFYNLSFVGNAFAWQSITACAHHAKNSTPTVADTTFYNACYTVPWQQIYAGDMWESQTHANSTWESQAHANATWCTLSGCSSVANAVSNDWFNGTTATWESKTHANSTWESQAHANATWCPLSYCEGQAHANSTWESQVHANATWCTPAGCTFDSSGLESQAHANATWESQVHANATYCKNNTGLCNSTFIGDFTGTVTDTSAIPGTIAVPLAMSIFAVLTLLAGFMTRNLIINLLAIVLSLIGAWLTYANPTYWSGDITSTAMVLVWCGITLAIILRMMANTSEATADD